MLLLALLLSTASLTACHTAQVSVPASSTEPMPTAAAMTERAVMIGGQVFSTQDSTTVIPGVELFFRNALADSTGQRFRTVTGPDGSYQMELKTGQTYQVTLNKDGLKVGEQQYALPVTPLDSSGLIHNIYVAYDVGPMVDPLPPMLFFTINQATLRPESKTQLDNIAAILKRNPGIGVSIEGHSEPLEVPRNQPSRAQYQLQLGQHRAQAANDYLAKKGIPLKQRIIKSYGGERLAAPDDNAEERQLNRRVELKFILVEDIARRKADEHSPASVKKLHPRLTGSKNSSRTRNVKKAPPKL